MQISIKTIKHCWNWLKYTSINKAIDYVYELEELILLRYQFSPNWSIVSKQSQTKT